MTSSENKVFSGDYIATTIPYVNAPPHVGFALEVAQTDVLARALALFGTKVHCSTGTDDHSLKNVRAAEARGEPVRTLVARNAASFEALNAALGADFHDFVSTSRDARHPASVERLLRACSRAGDLYRRTYTGRYCVGCESFVTEEELADGLCPEHGKAPELVSEENWFFRLSRYEAALRDAIRSGRLRILPEGRKNEVLAFIDRGLEDFSVSRSAARARGFGVPFPDDPDQVVYVWVDALANYLTTFDYGRSESSSNDVYSGWETANRRIHVLGKGVLRFHALYWPALLLSAGLPLPDELRVHGYLTVEGKKIGKSLGNGLDPLAVAETYGQTALRHYLLRHIPAFKDADFSRERLVALHDAELSNELGNLARRALCLAHRHGKGVVPAPGKLGASERGLETIAKALPERLRAALDQHELGQAFEHVWTLVRSTNRYVDLEEPWRLARGTSAEDAERLRTVLATAIGALRVLAVALAPFLPLLAKDLANSVCVALAPGALARLSIFSGLPVGEALGAPTVLAPRLAVPKTARPISSGVLLY